MKIHPYVDLAFKVVILVLSVFSAGSAFRPHFISVETAADIQGMSATALFIVSGIYTIVGTGVAPSATLVGKVAMWLLAPILALSLLSPGSARAASKLPIPLPPLKQVDLSSILPQTKLSGKPLTDLDAAFKAIEAISLDDLKAAKADADATKDDLASACYAPLIDLVAAQQSVDTSALQDGKPHVVLTFQRGRDLYNALRPGSAVSRGCSPMAEQIKTDIVTLIAQIAAGTVTMASFGL